MRDTLHLVLKHNWFEKIKSGEKRFEYRECKPFWDKKFQPVLDGKKTIWKHVIFHDGYTDRIIKCELLSIDITTEKNDLNKSQVYRLKLGQILN